MANPLDDQNYFGGLGQTLLGRQGISPVIGTGLGAALLGNAATLLQNPGSTGSLVRGLMSGLPAQSAATSSGTQPWTPAPAANADEAPVAAAVGQDGVDGNANSRGTAASPFDVDKAIAHLDANATPSYDKDKNGHCAAAVREAIAAGGRQVSNTPDAKDYGPNLVAAGFTQLDAQGLKNYTPQKGDVIVIPAVGTHTSGHMEMYDGKHWVSDFMQNSQFPLKGVKNPTPYDVYRP